MKLKPLPKLIIILAIVGGVGFGLNYAINKGTFKRPVQAPLQEQDVQVPQPPAAQADQLPAPEQAQDQPAPPAPPATPAPPAPVPSDNADSGISSLLKAGNK